MGSFLTAFLDASHIFFNSFSCNFLPWSGCSALHGVNSNQKENQTLLLQLSQPFQFCSSSTLSSPYKDGLWNFQFDFYFQIHSLIIKSREQIQRGPFEVHCLRPNAQEALDVVSKINLKIISKTSNALW